jgi:hypothetical protein
MKSVLFAILALIGSVSPATLDDAALTVDEVVERHHELDGQAIRVRGWLTLCQPLSCSLSSSPQRGDGFSLSIGGSDSFDRAVAGLIGRKIVVDAKLDAKCLHIQVDAELPSDVLLCLDRAPVLTSPRLVGNAEE